MHSAKPKVLHEVCGRPMLFYPLEAARRIGIKRVIVVIGAGGLEVRRILAGLCEFAWQRKPHGTGDAVLKCVSTLQRFNGDVVVLCGDAPLIQSITLEKLIARHRSKRAQATLLTAEVDDPYGYGRIVRDGQGAFQDIREDVDAGVGERKITEVNSGAYVFNWCILRKFLGQVGIGNRQGECYLTDVPRLISRAGLKVETVAADSADQIIGINTRVELAQVNKVMNSRILKQHALNGVTIVDPDTTYIEADVKIGKDTTIYPFSYIEKGVRIGRSCSIGPFAKIRSGSVIEDEAAVGSFVEVVRSKIGKRTNVKHLAYLGDAQVGRDVNVGAGTVTANFNGRTKQKTVIGDQAFIGCDTVLVAPVKVGSRAKTGAGAVILSGHHVKSGETVVGIPAKPLKKKRFSSRRKK